MSEELNDLKKYCEKLENIIMDMEKADYWDGEYFIERENELQEWLKDYEELSK